MPANLPSGVEVVDSDGDLLIIVMPEGSTVSKEVQAQNNDETGQTGNQESTQETTEGDQKEAPAEHQYKVSVKPMSLASPRAKVMFSGPWVEATFIHEDGLKHWVIRADFNPTAFGIVINVIHGRNEMVPETVDLDLLFDIATVVDDLGCLPALSFFGKLWISDANSHIRIPSLPDPELSLWAFISYVFQDPGIFEHITYVAIKRGIEDLDTMDLVPLLNINAAIAEKRQSYMQELERRVEIELEFLCCGSRNPCQRGVTVCQSMIIGDAVLYVRKHQDLSISSGEDPPTVSIEKKLDALEMFYVRPCYVPERTENNMTWTIRPDYGQYIDPRSPQWLQVHCCHSREVFGHIIDDMNRIIKGLTLEEIE